MIIAVDFDGTIVEHQYPRIGRGVAGAIKWLKRFQELGANLILWTMRCDDTTPAGNLLTEAVSYCQSRGLKFWAVNTNPQQNWTNSPKVYADVYIDDAAFGCPLVRSWNTRVRPYVNWDTVGPAIQKMLMEGEHSGGMKP